MKRIGLLKYQVSYQKTDLDNHEYYSNIVNWSKSDHDVSSSSSNPSFILPFIKF